MNLTKLDKAFSTYIRMRDVDDNGMVKCCTCPTVLHWKRMDCGHFRKRANLSTRWNEFNAANQCRICNGSEDGEYDKMELHLIRKFGAKVMCGVIEKSHTTWKPMQYEIDELTEYYKDKIKSCNT